MYFKKYSSAHFLDLYKESFFLGGSHGHNSGHRKGTWLHVCRMKLAVLNVFLSDCMACTTMWRQVSFSNGSPPRPLASRRVERMPWPQSESIAVATAIDFKVLKSTAVATANDFRVLASRAVDTAIDFKVLKSIAVATAIDFRVLESIAVDTAIDFRAHSEGDSIVICAQQQLLALGDMNT